MSDESSKSPVPSSPVVPASSASVEATSSPSKSQPNQPNTRGPRPPRDRSKRGGRDRRRAGGGQNQRPNQRQQESALRAQKLLEEEDAKYADAPELTAKEPIPEEWIQAVNGEYPKTLYCNRCKRDYLLKSCHAKVNTLLTEIQFTCSRCRRRLKRLSLKDWYNDFVAKEFESPPELDLSVKSGIH